MTLQILVIIGAFVLAGGAWCLGRWAYALGRCRVVVRVRKRGRPGVVDFFEARERLSAQAFEAHRRRELEALLRSPWGEDGRVQ